VLAEFGLDTHVLIATPQHLITKKTVSDLLPLAFGAQHLP
jgi:hypothetical protein